MPEACTLAGDPKARGGGKEQEQKVKKKKEANSRTKAATAAETPALLLSRSRRPPSPATPSPAPTRGGLWLSGRGRWHSIVEGGSRGIGGLSSAAGKISRNLRLSPLRASGPAAAFASAAVAAGDAASSSPSSSLLLASGRTLVVDFGFYRHPSAIGHWAEVAGQLASHVFAEEGKRE